jgi:hypothetical protein
MTDLPQPASRKARQILVLLIVLAAAVYLHRPHSGSSRALDEKLLGVWTTDSPTYAGRRLEIQKDLIMIRFSNDRIYTETISGVDTEPYGDGARFTIHTISYDSKYRPQDKHNAEWRLDYDPGHGGTIRLQHQPKVVWRKIQSGTGK